VRLRAARFFERFRDSSNSHIRLQLQLLSVSLARSRSSRALLPGHKTPEMTRHGSKVPRWRGGFRMRKPPSPRISKKGSSSATRTTPITRWHRYSRYRARARRRCAGCAKTVETGMPDYPIFERDANLARVRSSAEFVQFNHAAVKMPKSNVFSALMRPCLKSAIPPRYDKDGSRTEPAFLDN